MRHIPEFRLNVLMALFFATGGGGIVLALLFFPPQYKVIITFLALINVGLGAFFTYVRLTQAPKAPDKRKRRRDRRP
ncbi:MAG: hypothetical protein MPI95_02345 [Nitrosopumilus sp.]|nr:hypothetical protein [Nitrosopumilus sp.]CAI9832684.1 conserved hypothetical protein [Nitrosopumilaceae archaeon]MDA7941464.1 hypothetical protein [Nitrosopumilus sp.]MDA7943395.1 hypothetical protein [Nitrosopumilus sp.]MDA7945547.1 hypothetical protein [Nitrosopumilus sp.]